MAKNKDKKPVVEAPVVEKPAAEEANVEQPATVQMANTGMPSGLSQDAKTAYLTGIQHRKDEMLKNGGENANKYVALTMIEDATILDIALTETFIRKNPTGLILIANEQNWKTFQLLGEDLGVRIPDYKSLPKPTKEQLKVAGLEPVPGQVVLKLENKHLSDKVNKEIKKDAKLNDDATSGKKEYLKDHTKIETDEQLKEALGFQLTNHAISNPVERLITAAQFYRAHLEVKSDKADDPKAELAKVSKLTIPDLLQDIITMVEPTFILEGFGKRLGTLAEDANSVVPAFCSFKDCLRNKKTGTYAYDDPTIAAITRVLIAWYVSAKSAELSKSIADKEENIKVLKKDEKKNAKGIETETKKIAGLKASIEHFNNLLSLVTDPSFDVADNFIAIYNDKEHKDHISACAIAKAILYTYYRDIDIPELEFDSALLNIQQRVGIILNMFSAEIAKRDDYSEDNLIEISTENQPTEEEGKNALWRLRKLLETLYAECEIIFSHNLTINVMKRLTTILCCIMLMIGGAGLALSNLESLPQNTITASVPHERPVPVIVGKKDLPLDIQLDLDKRASESRATSKDSINIRDSINIIDSVRWVTKTKWKTRYRRSAHITRNGTGNEMAAVNPDSLSSKPVNNDMLVREEKTKEEGISPKPIPIQLTVGGKVVYSTNDIHSGVEGQ